MAMDLDMGLVMDLDMEVVVVEEEDGSVICLDIWTRVLSMDLVKKRLTSDANTSETSVDAIDNGAANQNPKHRSRLKYLSNNLNRSYLNQFPLPTTKHPGLSLPSKHYQFLQLNHITRLNPP
jgi:hypothetical protein